MRLAAELQENHERFVRRSVAGESVWVLLHDEHRTLAYCLSNEYEDVDVLLVWSDRGYAKRAEKSEFHDYSVKEVPLFDFLFRYLPGMHDDEVLVGTNFTGDLHGLEKEPADLQRELKDAMPRAMLEGYDSRLQKMIRAGE